MYDEAGHLIGEYDGSGNLIEETVWLGDIPVATLQPNGSGGINIFYIHTDHLNTPRKISQPTTGTLAWRWDSDPFGTAAPNQNPGGLGTFVYNERFLGQYYQAETGLNYNYFRDYDPQVGSYVESDPLGLRGGSYATYAYTQGNPVSLEDFLGLCPDSKCSDPRYAQAREFIHDHLADALQIASQLETTPGNILGLSGLESGYGSGFLIAAGTNNYWVIVEMSG